MKKQVVSGSREDTTSIRLRVSPDQAKARASILKALGHPVRLQIVDLLAQGDSCPCDFHPLFNIRQPTLSRHLAVLKHVGLITERRKGPRTLLHLATPCIVRAFDCAMEVVQTEHARRARSLKNNPTG